MTRIQVSLGDRALELVDRYADAMGVTRSSLCAVLIGQGLMNYNPAFLGGGGAGIPELEIGTGPRRPLDEVLAEAAQKKAEGYDPEVYVKGPDEDDEHKVIL